MNEQHALIWRKQAPRRRIGWNALGDAIYSTKPQWDTVVEDYQLIPLSFFPA